MVKILKGLAWNLASFVLLWVGTVFIFGLAAGIVVPRHATALVENDAIITIVSVQAFVVAFLVVSVWNLIGYVRRRRRQ